MRNLLLQEKKLNLMKLQTAEMELEFKISKALEDIERLKDHIEKNKQAQEELKREIGE